MVQHYVEDLEITETDQVGKGLFDFNPHLQFLSRSRVGTIKLEKVEDPSEVVGLYVPVSDSSDSS